MIGALLSFLWDLSILEIVLGIFAVLGVLASLLFLWLVYEDHREAPARQIGFEPTPVDRGAPIVDYANREALQGLARAHKIEAAPSKIERGRKRSIRGGPKALAGRAERNERETIEQPDDLADLVYRILGFLKEKDKLDQTADCVHADLLDGPTPIYMDEREAAAYYRDWLEESYPNGVDGITTETLAKALATIGRRPPDGRVHEVVVEALERLNGGPQQLLFLEGEWTVASGEEGVIRLHRKDLRVTVGRDSFHPQSLPMPAGVSITAALPAGELTTHGKTRMLNASPPIRACMIATTKGYDATTSCFELAPIAVFQRVD